MTNRLISSAFAFLQSIPRLVVEELQMILAARGQSVWQGGRLFGRGRFKGTGDAFPIAATRR